MSKMLRAILVVILASLTLGLLITGCAGDSQTSTATVGQSAPDFELQNLDGQPVSLSDFKGRPVLINFWASWCDPCVSEMSYLEETYDEWSGKELMLLAINNGESSATVKQYMQDNNLSFPVLLDTKAVVARKYNIQFLPTTFFIDKDGIIQEKVIGAFPNKAAIEKRLNKIMP